MKRWKRASAKRALLLLMTAVFLVLTFIPPVDQKAVGNYTMIAIGATMLLFAFRYVGFSNWRHTVAGRALAYLSIAFGTFATWVSLSTNLGERWFWGWTEVRVLLYGTLFLATLNMLLTLIDIQRGVIARDSSSYEDTLDHREPGGQGH